jgi:hypothetical protein
VWRKAPSPAVQGLLDFASSIEGKKVLQDAGFVLTNF